MTNDYKGRVIPPETPNKSGLPTLVFVVGLLIGALISALVCLKVTAPKGPSPARPPAAEAPAAPAASAPKEEQPAQSEAGGPKPRFEFYTILAEREVVVPDAGIDPNVPLDAQAMGEQPRVVQATELDAVAEARPDQPAPEPLIELPGVAPAEPAAPAAPAADRYMLQMGSFKTRDDAERMRGEMILLNIAAEIQRVTINNGQVFYRVRSGPYNRTESARLSARLKRNAFDSLTLKLKD